MSSVSSKFCRPDRDELETMIISSGLATASWRFTGSPHRTKLIKQWCEEYSIAVPDRTKK